MKYFLLITALFLSLSLYAQNKVNELITDRPDQTESSMVVPEKKLQIESGFLMETDEENIYEQKSFAFNTTLLRYGLLENFELRLGFEYLGEKIKTGSSGDDYNTYGFSPLYAGFKVKIADEDNRRPEIAFIGGLVLPFTAGNDFRPDHTAANIRFALSHTLSDKLSLGYNLGAEWDGISAIPGYFYSLALNLGISDRFGMFTEGFGLIREKGDTEHLLDTGFTFLLMPNLQFDISAGIGVNEHAIDNFISFGFSYRIPK